MIKKKNLLASVIVSGMLVSSGLTQAFASPTEGSNGVEMVDKVVVVSSGHTEQGYFVEWDIVKVPATGKATIQGRSCQKIPRLFGILGHRGEWCSTVEKNWGVKKCKSEFNSYESSGSATVEMGSSSNRGTAPRNSWAIAELNLKTDATCKTYYNFI